MLQVNPSATQWQGVYWANPTDTQWQGVSQPNPAHTQWQGVLLVFLDSGKFLWLLGGFRKEISLQTQRGASAYRLDSPGERRTQRREKLRSCVFAQQSVRDSVPSTPEPSPVC